MAVRNALRITLIRREYQPGDIVEGTVTLSGEKPIREAQVHCVARPHTSDTFQSLTCTLLCSVLVASLLCREGLTWHDAEDALRRQYHVLHESQRALTRVNTSFPIGDHTFPIKWTLPDTLPRHFRLNYGGANSFLESCVDVTLQISGKREFTEHVVEVFDVTVPPAMVAPRPVGTPQQKTASREFKRFGLVRCGTCSMDVDLASNVLDAKSPLQLRIRIRNSSSRTCQSLTATLVQYVRGTSSAAMVSSTAELHHWDIMSQYFKAEAEQQKLQASRSRSIGTDVEVAVAFLPVVQATPAALTRTSNLLKVSFWVDVTCSLGMLSFVSVRIPIQVIEADLGSKS